MVVVGMGEENSSNWFCELIDAAANLFPSTPGINDQKIVLVFKQVGVFISDGIDNAVDFHKSSFLY